MTSNLSQTADSDSDGFSDFYETATGTEPFFSVEEPGLAQRCQLRERVLEKLMASAIRLVDPEVAGDARR